MNCKRFSIAEIVSAKPHAAHLIGKRVVVTYPLQRHDGVVCWMYVTFDGKPLQCANGRIGYLEDHHLKAIDAEAKERA